MNTKPPRPEKGSSIKTIGPRHARGSIFDPARRFHFPCTCSGDMYWNVPTIIPFSVSGEFAAGLDRLTVKLELATLRQHVSAFESSLWPRSNI